MILMRLNGQVFLAMDLEVKRTIKSNYYAVKESIFDSELIGYWWNLESCEEAIQLFEIFHVCPVCGAMADASGLLAHKENFIN